MHKAPSLTLEAWFRDAVAERLGPDVSAEGYRNALQRVLIGFGSLLGTSRGLTPEWPFEKLEVPCSILEAMDPEDLGNLYQRALGVRPCPTGGEIQWSLDPETRRRAGAYYTPPELIRKLLDFALDPVIEELKTNTKVCDLACGSGRFLVAACSRIASATGCSPAEVAEHQIFGFDNDPTAIEVCRLVLWLRTGFYPRCGIRLADSLLDRSIPDEQFDVILGNPPFGGVVDGRIPPALARARPERFQELGGTADLSYYFFSLATKLLGKRGRIGMVMPRAFLSARSAVLVRRPASFQVLERSVPTVFEGASVNVCLVGYRARESEQDGTHQPEGRPLTLELRASLTVSEAYKIVPRVRDGHRKRGLKLVTTGLIEPRASKWGVARCRFLKSSFQYPRIVVTDLPPARAKQALRPKLIVAGLSRTLECFLDSSAECVGSVGTYTILHPKDDLEQLQHLMEYLHSPRVHNRLIEELGASALSGGNITLTKPFLRSVLQRYESHLWESNPRPSAYKAGALPLS